MVSSSFEPSHCSESQTAAHEIKFEIQEDRFETSCHCVIKIEQIAEKMSKVEHLGF